MLEYGEFTGLANDEIGPLDNDNGDKEGSVAGVFKDFTVPEKKNIKYQLVVDNRLVYVLRYYNFGRYFGFDITIFWNEN